MIRKTSSKFRSVNMRCVKAFKLIAFGKHHQRNKKIETIDLLKKNINMYCLIRLLLVYRNTARVR